MGRFGCVDRHKYLMERYGCVMGGQNMNREERIKRQMSGWLRRTNFNFGRARAGGARVSQHAIEHMRRKPYTNQMMVREEATANE